MAEIKISVNLIAYSGRDVLLIKRGSTAFFCGWYALVAGHVEPQETVPQAMLREAAEEIGVSHFKASDLTLVSLVSRVYDTFTYHDLVFAAPLARDCPLRLEERKVADSGWFDCDDLPINTIPYMRDIVQRFFAEPGAVTVSSYAIVNGELTPVMT